MDLIKEGPRKIWRGLRLDRKMLLKAHLLSHQKLVPLRFKYPLCTERVVLLCYYLWLNLFVEHGSLIRSIWRDSQFVESHPISQRCLNQRDFLVKLVSRQVSVTVCGPSQQKPHWVIGGRRYSILIAARQRSSHLWTPLAGARDAFYKDGRRDWSFSLPGDDIWDRDRVHITSASNTKVLRPRMDDDDSRSSSSLCDP